MVLTVLEAHVAPERVDALEAAYTAPDVPRPSGFVRSALLRSRANPTLWRIQTLWESMEALERMRRSAGTPAGVLMFRAAGAEPTLTVFEVARELGPAE